MIDLLAALPAGGAVLDLGSGSGSFLWEGDPLTIVRLDLEAPSAPAANFVRADAAALPFPDQRFDLIISNHSLEHIENLAGALGEIGRVIRSSGALYIGVPDATTFSDRLYRWLARGGGHVNPFSSAGELAARVSAATGLPHVATRTLCSSLACLNRRNRRSRAPRRLWLLGGGTETSLRLFSYVARWCDRLLGTRASVYGWALFFGNIAAPIDCHTWANVCVRCGSGYPSAWLVHKGLVTRRLLFRGYGCPGCGAWNLFTDDAAVRGPGLE